MTTLADIAMIGGIVDALARHGSWCGETHIQKAGYLAKVIEHVPLEYNFILYKYGPYSFELSKSVNHMRSRGVLRVIPRRGYGPSYELNVPLWAALNRATGGVFDAHSQKIDKVCAYLSAMKVDELERIATAVFVQKAFPKLGRDKKIAKLRELKPHIPEGDASAAFVEAARLKRHVDLGAGEGSAVES